MRHRVPAIVSVPAALLLLTVSVAHADTLRLTVAQDNTLYEEPAGALSNGTGTRLFAGRTGQALNSVRRAVLRFDLSGLPEDATVTGVTLLLTVVQSSDTTSRDVSLHRVLASWGEGTTAASGGQGSGGPATAGSATWLHRFHPDSLWTTPGGDYRALASSTISVGTSGVAAWTGPGLIDDVHAWLADSTANHGWVLRDAETASATTRAFASDEDPVAANRPALEITYDPPAPVRSATWGRLKADPR